MFTRGDENTPLFNNETSFSLTPIEGVCTAGVSQELVHVFHGKWDLQNNSPESIFIVHKKQFVFKYNVIRRAKLLVLLNIRMKLLNFFLSKIVNVL